MVNMSSGFRDDILWWFLTFSWLIDTYAEFKVTINQCWIRPKPILTSEGWRSLRRVEVPTFLDLQFWKQCVDSYYANWPQKFRQNNPFPLTLLLASRQNDNQRPTNMMRARHAPSRGRFEGPPRCPAVPACGQCWDASRNARPHVKVSAAFAVGNRWERPTTEVKSSRRPEGILKLSELW